MRGRYETLELPLAAPFTIARKTTTTTENVVVELTHEGTTGYGAAAPSVRYGETTESVEAILPKLLDVVEDVGDPHARRTIADRMTAVAGESPAARAAIDVALWDLAGRLLEAPVYRLLGLSPGDRCPPTSLSIGIDETDRMRQRARAAADAGYAALKVKLGTDRDREIVDAVRAAAPDVALRVDANEAWDAATARGLCQFLAERDVELIEQPVPADDLAALEAVHEDAAVPIAVDEAWLTAADLPTVADRCDVVVVKLMKAGGLTPAIEAIHTANALDLDVMGGCMVETDVSIAAAANLLPLFEYADLDGSLLLAEDPYAGVPVEGGRFDLAAVDRGTGAHPR